MQDEAYLASLRADEEKQRKIHEAEEQKRKEIQEQRRKIEVLTFLFGKRPMELNRI